MTGLTAKSGTTSVVTTGITYKNPTSTTTSTQVYKWTTGGKTYTYTYDVRGNITAIADGTYTTTYVYDGLDQLTRENNQAAGKTWVYTYDNGGNILSKTEYDYTTDTLGTALDTITYGYGDSDWKDLLTSYDGQTLTSDNIGNLTNDGTWSYTWQHGRQLAQMSRANGAALEYLNYTYDADGRRIGKERETIVTVGGEAISNSSTTKYIYLGDTLTEMQIVNVDESVDTFRFTYDATGPMSMTFYGTEYFYLKNAQGDVTGIVNAAGTQVVAYTYDAWGKLLSTTGTMAGSIGTLNPFRYRGYVYDTETGLYYLNSRYYNPETGRFINADSENLLTATPESATWDKNLFAYCDNNPITRIDGEGHVWNIIIGAAVGGIVSGGMSIITSLAVGEPIDWVSVAIDAASGAVSGALTALGAGIVADIVCESASNYAMQVYEVHIGERESVNYFEMAASVAVGVGYGKYADVVSDSVVKPLNQTRKTAVEKTNTYVSKAVERSAANKSSSYYTKRAVKNTEVKQKTSKVITAVKSFFSSLFGSFKPF